LIPHDIAVLTFAFPLRHFADLPAPVLIDVRVPGTSGLAAFELEGR
jgi:hypothetical protein